MTSIEVRRAVQSEFSAQGLTLDKDALGQLAGHVEAACECEGGGVTKLRLYISELLDAVDAGVASKISGPAAAQLLARLAGGGSRVDYQIQLISAFDIPSIKYDPIRRAFYQASGVRALHGSAQDKQAVYLNRYLLLQQRVRRNPKFCRPAFGGLGGDQRHFVELTEIKGLLGSMGQTRFVMGCISQPEDGRFALVDMSGTILMDITGAITTSGFYTENCIVMTEGSVQASGIFKVTALGFPPIEPRSESLAAAKGLDFFGGMPVAHEDLGATLEWEAQREEDRIVVLSDLWLDRPETLDRLHVVMSGAGDNGRVFMTAACGSGFDELEDPPSLFVLMGSFASPAHSAHRPRIAAGRSNFSSLASCLARYTRLLEASKFVFMPGPSDMGPGQILPQPPLPRKLTGDLRTLLPNAIFASNPARVRWGSQEIALFRGDLSGRMRALSLLPPDSASTDPAAQFAHVCATVLQQSHLCPLPLDAQPVFWQHDAGLHLYPVPDALVIADSAPMMSHTFAACACMNPGSIGSGTFVAYNPLARDVELCDIPEPDPE